MAEMSEGTKEDIHARVLVLNDGNSRLIFVTYDLNCLDVATPILRQKVRSALEIGLFTFDPIGHPQSQRTNSD